MPRGRRTRERGPDLGPLLVLLLPARLEAFALRERAEDLLEAPGAVAVEPAKVGAMRRLPGALRDGIAATQARRLALPGTPRALLIFGPEQYPLARALIADTPELELWYAQDPAGPPPGAMRELHEAARGRAAFSFSAGEGEPGGPHDRNRPLFERMEALGIESGRLGSERLARTAPDD